MYVYMYVYQFPRAPMSIAKTCQHKVKNKQTNKQTKIYISIVLFVVAFNSSSPPYFLFCFVLFCFVNYLLLLFWERGVTKTKNYI